MLFQDPDTQFCMLRVDDEIAFGLENLGVPRSAMAGRIAAALQQAGLDCPLSTRITALSGGNKQRLALACVLALEPRVLIFDEPTSHLDPWSAQHVATMIGQLKAQGDHTVILIEHRLDHLMDLVDRLLLFGQEGTILADGTPRQVLQEQAGVLDELGIWIPQVSELARTLRSRGLTVDPYPLTLADATAALQPLVESGRDGGWKGTASQLRFATQRPHCGAGAEGRQRSVTIHQDRSLVFGAADRSRGPIP
jgi:energy-coupling factor transport system ATP-binding protein